ELSERAKENARDWYLSRIYWPEEVEPETDNWKKLAEKLGFGVNSGPWWDADRGQFHFLGEFYRPDDADLDALEKEWGPNPETGWTGNPEVLALISEVRAIRPGLWGGVGKSGIERSEIDEDDPELEELESAGDR